MSDKTTFTDFLDVLDNENSKLLKVQVSSKAKPISVQPLSFKQQKSLITSGMNGVKGSMQFLKNLNDTIIENSKEQELKIYDKIPICLELRKNITDSDITQGEVSVKVEELQKLYKKFDIDETAIIKGDEFTMTLKIPTLVDENRYISSCIEEIKRVSDEDMARIVSVIVSYELPKFIDKVSFKENELVFSELSNSQRSKILDKLPATVTNEINEFILKVRKYDEDLLTLNETQFEIDPTFFE